MRKVPPVLNAYERKFKAESVNDFSKEQLREFRNAAGIVVSDDNDIDKSNDLTPNNVIVMDYDSDVLVTTNKKLYETLRMAYHGADNDTIARTLNIKTNTVMSYRWKNIKYAHVYKTAYGQVFKSKTIRKLASILRSNGISISESYLARLIRIHQDHYRFNTKMGTPFTETIFKRVRLVDSDGSLISEGFGDE